MQQYYGGGGAFSDGDWIHELAAFPPLPLCSPSPPPLLVSGDSCCLPAMAAATALPTEDCSSALMLRADEQMGCSLPAIPPPASAVDVYGSYALDVGVLPPLPADFATAGLDDALLMQPFSDIDLEVFADAVLHEIKPEPLDVDDAIVSVDHDFGVRPVVTMNQQNAPRMFNDLHDDDASAVVAGGYEAAPVGFAEHDEQARPAPRRARRRSDGSSGGGGAAAGGRSLDHVGFEELRKYFYMPITKAAREMNVGLTVLKKRCRELGVARWPHRKMKSLRSLILNIQEMGKGATSPTAVQRELEALERYCARMEENPAIELTEQTKKLRQACFKENYKRRRAAAVNLLDYNDDDLGGHQQQQQMEMPRMSFYGF